MRSTRAFSTAISIGLVGLACVWSGCQSNDRWDGQVPAPDYARFEHEAYPVLLRDCAFGECHGRAMRLFRVWGPGRVRLDPNTRIDEDLTPMEVQRTYARARSMLASESPRELPPLLAKPLEERAGGIAHRGLDAFGRNVYQSPDDPGFVTLMGWAQSVAASVPPASVTTPPPVPTPEGPATLGDVP